MGSTAYFRSNLCVDVTADGPAIFFNRLEIFISVSSGVIHHLAGANISAIHMLPPLPLPLPELLGRSPFSC